MKIDIGYSRKAGFTLIELVVVVAIIATLFAAVALLFNPFAQIQKAKNATRQHDINEIKNALDVYFNDVGCYPKSLTFGSKFSTGATTYIQKIPQDPDCAWNNASACYDYETDGSTCPKWNILYAHMQTPVASGIGSCVLLSANNTSSCLPTGGMLSYNYCAVSGKLDCLYISTNALPAPSAPPAPTSGAGGGSGGGGGATVTPIAPSLCTSMYLSSCSNGVCNSKQASQCLGCGGAQQCYPDLVCGGTKC